MPEHNRQNQCPALFIVAPASAQGKTTVTAALARYYRGLGKKVRIFKCGPDFLDPMILSHASGEPVYQLDLWMGNEPHYRHLLYQASLEADIILIEGAMGMFDGDHSSAALAALFDIPMLIVIDATAMAQTFGAIALGLASYNKAIKVAGIFANRVASQNHFEMLAESLPPGLPLFGWMKREPMAEFPKRHLGLVQANEIANLEQCLSSAVNALHGIDEFLLSDCTFTDAEPQDNNKKLSDKLLSGKHIAIAKDAAFSFLYQANLDFLIEHGASLQFFSPLYDVDLPDCDAVYLPGGYPELHLDTLADNQSMQASILEHIGNGKPLYAECGGMLYLLDSLSSVDGHRAGMLGALPGQARMQEKLASLGLHEIELFGASLRGHSYHYSQAEINAAVIGYSSTSRKGRKSEPFYAQGSLRASYLHLYFPSNPGAAQQLFLS